MRAPSTVHRQDRGMNVKEVMSREIKTIRMVDRLDAAARVMWEQDCGIVPVVDGNQALVGVVTDRDLCMAGYTQGRPLGEIPVTTVMARGVATCRPDEALATAVALMQQRQIHRLPVVDARNVVVGMLATNDLVRLAHSRPAAFEATNVLKTLAAIAAPRRAAVAVSAPVTTPTKPAAAPVAVPAAKAVGTNATAAVTASPAAAPVASAPADKAGKGKGGGGKGKGKK
jgi:CBS domain-containing protein